MYRPSCDRYARTVQHARLSLPPDAGSHRLTALMEEALRLASLPGENEGRVYRFRRLRVRGLPASGDRTAWLNGFQSALAEQAADAVHAEDPRSPSARAVYFRSEAEVIEVLLVRLLTERRVKNEPNVVKAVVKDEWFWPEALATADIPTLIEALRRLPASWTAVAAILFHGSSPRRIDHNLLLASTSPGMAEAWVRELDRGTPPPSLFHLHFNLPPTARDAVVRAIARFGADDPRVLWLTALAVLHSCPADIAGGALVHRSREVLRNLINSAGRSERPPSIEAAREVEASHFSRPEPETQTASRATESISAPLDPVRDAPRVVAHQICETKPISLELSPSPPPSPSPIAGAAPPATLRTWLGAPTQAAGLLFLLNAFAWLGLPDALDQGLAWECPDFAARLLAHLAEHAQIREGDPILDWLCSVILPDAVPASIHRQLRIWAVRARRWCWHTGHITVREIVNRSGIFSADRTDVDVSLPLDTADVRIRLAGLDLDPGWLPWFGRVVRFHYPGRRELYG